MQPEIINIHAKKSDRYKIILVNRNRVGGFMELLAPAGDLERLKIAIKFGADAVYIGGKDFSLRAGASNFTIEDMYLGVEFAHNLGKKVYLAANAIPHREIKNYSEFLQKVVQTKIDAIIISDAGIFDITRKVAPNMEIHMSTQAGITNYKSAEFWHKLGAKRIVLARELSIEEIKDIRLKCSVELELEAFVHGSMCVSHSGRCLLSNYMTQRNANLGDCAQSCRWKYFLMEETRPGEYMPVFEDENGTFIYNSKDLCMIEHIDKLADCRLNSLKIEGRMKTEYYIASVVKTYRQAIDEYLISKKRTVDPQWLEELKKVSHRGYTTGFFLGNAECSAHNYETSSYTRSYILLGIVIDYDAKTRTVSILNKNKFCKGDTVEFLMPHDKILKQKIEFLLDQDGNKITIANKPHSIFKINANSSIEIGSMMRAIVTFPN